MEEGVGTVGEEVAGARHTHPGPDAEAHERIRGPCDFQPPARSEELADHVIAIGGNGDPPAEGKRRRVPERGMDHVVVATQDHVAVGRHERPAR